jgi:hypothetical protein
MVLIFFSSFSHRTALKLTSLHSDFHSAFNKLENYCVHFNTEQREKRGAIQHALGYLFSTEMLRT